MNVPYQTKPLFCRTICFLRLKQGLWRYNGCRHLVVFEGRLIGDNRGAIMNVIRFAVTAVIIMGIKLMFEYICTLGVIG